ncbi:MAG: sigma-70 family RNA polymerase sigma factor, partial [Acidobacteriota bacterium]
MASQAEPVRVSSIEKVSSEDPRSEPAHDRALLDRFTHDAEGAWRLFLDRHASYVLGVLRGLGLDRDEAMDGFVYVCERLVADDYRRLRSIRFLGGEDDLRPWLRQVTRRAAVSWLWSRAGRRRFSRPIERFSTQDQEVFSLYFWHGLAAAEIHHTLATRHPRLRLLDVLDALERVMDALGSKRIWRLVSQDGRRRRAEGEIEETPATRDDPERALLLKEATTRMRQALDTLSSRERLVVQLRYEDALGKAEIAS